MSSRKAKRRVATDGGDGLAHDNPFADLATDGLRQEPENGMADEPAEERTVQRSGPRPTVRLRRLKAGKGGKVVTEISGFRGGAAEAQALVGELRSALGTGGTAKEAVIELQGECRDRVKGLLEKGGYRVLGV